jgi:glycerophosphoryl diester phosphodiesterase
MAAGVLPIAHRGASGIAPENTKVAFVMALDLGARAIEFDVQLTRDNVAIVFHDDTLDRTTNGAGSVADTDFSVIERLDAGAWFSDKYRRVEVPTLEEVLSSLRKRALLNIELKPDARIERLVRHVVTAVARFDLFDLAVFSSFDPDAIRILRRLVPDARLGVLCMPDGIDEALRLAEDVAAENLHPPKSIVDEAFVRMAHDAGYNVWSWTANTPADIERLVVAGVDGIFSDYVDRVRTIAVRTGRGVTGTR